MPIRVPISCLVASTLICGKQCLRHKQEFSFNFNVHILDASNVIYTCQDYCTRLLSFKIQSLKLSYQTLIPTGYTRKKKKKNPWRRKRNKNFDEITHTPSLVINQTDLKSIHINLFFHCSNKESYRYISNSENSLTQPL